MLIEAEYSERTGKLELKMIEYIGDVLQENILDQKDGGNGFTEGRSMRRTASIPSTIFREWQLEFEKRHGVPPSVAVNDWRKFRERKLSEHPEYRTVDKMLHVTPYAGNIIVK